MKVRIIQTLLLLDIMSCAVEQRWKDQIRAQSHPPIINY